MKKNLLIILIFIILTIVMTYPLILHIKDYIPGFYSTDEPFAVLWDGWRMKHTTMNFSALRSVSLISYPFGVELYTYGNTLGIMLKYVLNHFANYIVVWNMQILLNILLSAIFTYLLMFYLTNNSLASMFAGVAYAFCPYQFSRLWQHFGLTNNEWLPLALLAVISLKDKFAIKPAVLLLLSIILSFSFDYTITYFIFIGVGLCVIYRFFYNWKAKLSPKTNLLWQDLRFLGRISLVGLIALIILSPQFITIIKNIGSVGSSATDFNSYRRPFEHLFIMSARPLSYFLPAVAHPVFGKFTEQFLGSPLYGLSITEHSLYLGWIVLILAFIALRRWRKSEKTPYSENYYTGLFIFIAIGAWLFSQPPWWQVGPLKIYMPSFFMYKILPMFRAYCRFGIVLMLAVAGLTAFGLKFILERFKSQRTKIAITALFCCLALFDFWNYPPFKVIDVSKVPSVYYWLKDEPADTVIAEYPLDTEGANYMYLFAQTKHGKKMINGTIPGSYANQITQTITQLSGPRTSGVLKWMGVRYVLVHSDSYLNAELTQMNEELVKISHNSGLKLVKSFPAQDCLSEDIRCSAKSGPVDVYEVIAKAVKPEIKEK